MKRMPAVFRLLTASIAMSLAGTAGAAKPEPFPNGLILDGPYLFCGDEQGMFHILDSDRPFVRAIGVYASGPGVYVMPNGMEKVEYKRGNGEVSYKGIMRRLGVGIEQSATIEGKRIRIAVKRTGEWPRDVVGVVRIPLPVDRYGGAEFVGDGVKHAFPKEYSRDNRIPAGMKRLECNPGNSRLNLVLECADGFSIDDQRRFGSPTYIVGINLPGGDRDTVEFFITLPHLPSLAPARALRWSRIGYPIGGEKFVVMEWPKNAPRPDDGARLENRDGKTVKEGRFGTTEAPDHDQNNCARFDFTDIRAAGEYRVVWTGGSTDWFPIRASVFTNRLWEKTLDYFMPFEMCHAAVDLGPGVFAHGLCHADDAARAPANHSGPDGFVSYEAEGTPYRAGAHINLGLGGWHDAGDYDLNVPAQANVVWTLALAWEEFQLDRDVATLDTSARTFRTGKPDGVPDILAQVEWGSLWLLSVQQKDGRVWNGVCDKPAQRRGKPLETITDGTAGNDDDRLLYPDYHADAQMNHVIAMAAASRALKKARPGLAKKCLESAKRGFKYFLANREVYRKGSYTATGIKGRERDGAVMATAIELFLTTGEAEYMGIIEKLVPALPDLKFSWPLPRDTGAGGFRFAPPFLARLAPRLKDGKPREIVLDACRRAAKVNADRMAIRPWPFEIWEAGEWGNNGTMLARAFDTYWLTRVAPEVLPPEAPLRSMLWVFGLHTAGDTVFVSGLGYPETKYLYSQHLHALNGFAPGNVPGAVVPGMGGFWMSGVVAYIDEYGYYGNNEACIYTQSQYIFAVNAMRAMGF